MGKATREFDSQAGNKNMHSKATLRPFWHTFRVDASFDKQRGITGIGLILRAANKPGRDGAVVARFSEAYIGLPVQAGEQFAVLRALEIASERGHRLLRVRSDYNQMRIALKNDYEAGIVPDEHNLQVMILGVARRAVFKSQRRKNHSGHRQMWSSQTPGPSDGTDSDCFPAVREGSLWRTQSHNHFDCQRNLASWRCSFFL